jgi:hypothetical protein
MVTGYVNSQGLIGAQKASAAIQVGNNSVDVLACRWQIAALKRHARQPSGWL